MSTNIRVVVSHNDASGKNMSHFGTEQYLLTVATVDAAGISAVLSNNSKLRGSSFVIHSYANLDKQHIVTANLLT